MVVRRLLFEIWTSVVSLEGCSTILLPLHSLLVDPYEAIISQQFPRMNRSKKILALEFPGDAHIVGVNYRDVISQ